ncbi:branched-subunit amino acid transport protein [Rhodobacter viridis]|uniref:Branched-subunit amino acid transport protein n=1 Tax=Rhodobacter viridis TaxID=1054202 RepID=A0A318U0N3_9RHOB|nr:AzlD domain-containing protein [Rhodobacter viridis]PYF11082.1 branched-subunit amino acid transport protein [Rhodobacter viridis]
MTPAELYGHPKIWLIITALGIGTFVLRYSFLGWIGNRPLPEWALRHLRYTAVAVLPGLVAPLVLWPAATGGHPDPARLLAAGATLAVGLASRNTLAAILGGLVTLYLALWALG